MKKLIIPTALFLSSGLLQAAMPGAYLGVGAGLVSMDDASDAYIEDDTNFGGRAFLGYNFNSYFGFEAGYAALGDNVYRSPTNPNIGVDISMSAISAVAKLNLPLSNDSFNIYGAFGGAQVTAKYQILNSNFPSQTETGVVGTGAIGCSYDLNKNLVASLDLSYFGEYAQNNVIFAPAATLGTFNLAYKF